jgi:superfamily II DNA/RNA helicase
MANRTDTKFFTNEDGNSLYERFNHTLRNAQYFDSLVGYFRTSGFYRLYKSFENIEKIRILIGLNVDKKTLDVLQEVGQQKLDFESQANIRKQYQEEVKSEFEISEDTKDVDLGVNKFRELIHSGKIEMKACREQNIHAKIYITRYGEDMPIYGSVITGSSNFTENGLNAQYEFNVELKDTPDVEFALEKFEKLWEMAVPITEDYIEAIETKTWLNEKITPYEIYLKLLYEYFAEEINLENVINDEDLPDNYMKLDYQINAIAKINKIVKNYNGVFISDVVGLGKTYIAAMFAKILTGKILVIAPPPIVPNWVGAFKDFDIKTKNYDIESIGMLHKILKRIEKAEVCGERTYDYIFIDEAHRFRNGNNTQYEMIKRICLNKKVVLISATPLNNTFFDFYHLISLFQNPVDSDIPGVANLEAFFTSRRNDIKMVEKSCGGKDNKEYIDAVKRVSKEVRDKILKYLMIRRTRTDIKNHFEKDIKKQGLFFPEVQSPEKLIYKFDEHTNKVFENTIKIIGTADTPKSEKLTYARYAPKTYIKEEQLTAFERTQQMNNVGFMKSRLVKRLESSKYAFEMTLERAIKSHEKLIKMYNTGTIYISKEINVLDYIDDDTKTVEDLLEKGKEKELEAFDVSKFKEDFIIDIKHDLTLLKSLLNNWREINHDYKQEKFVYELQNNKLLKNKKMVIFTESAETGENLANILKEYYGDEVLFYSSCQKESLKELIKLNYDPNQKEYEQEDNIKYLITTDVLSEGINLHRSNIIVNYDLPWNPTRVMQRVGRVNRVGTKHDKIYIFNFFPTSETDKQLGLEESIIAKIQAFHNALGEDAKYLSETEEVESYNLRGEQLYKSLNSKESFSEQDEADPELKYLEVIRKIRDKADQGDYLFKKIVNLPKKIRVARSSKKVQDNSLITFFRKGNLHKFCINSGEIAHEIPFDEAVKCFECDETEEKEKMPQEYFDYLARNKDLFGQPIDEEISFVKRGKSKVDKIIRNLKGLINSPKYTQDDKIYMQSVINAFGSRKIPESIAKKLNTFFDSEFDDIKLLTGIKKIVPEAYLTQETSNKNNKKLQKREIVLSEFLYSRGE